jgi:tRNA(Leu) C34 or U34 (ribose-2'-O)-methylase TrmL
MLQPLEEYLSSLSWCLRQVGFGLKNAHRRNTLNGRKTIVSPQTPRSLNIVLTAAKVLSERLRQTTGFPRVS